MEFVCKPVLDRACQVLKECGLEESVEKAIPPSTSMFFLGILVDTVNCTLSITKERLDEGPYTHRKNSIKKYVIFPRKPNQMPVPGTAWNLSVSPF
jgi:hypothetical protein